MVTHFSTARGEQAVKRCRRPRRRSKPARPRRGRAQGKLEAAPPPVFKGGPVTGAMDMLKRLKEAMLGHV